MKLAILNSNVVSINKNTKKGTEIFDYILIKHLVRCAKKNRLTITAFASGNSKLPVKTESINYYSSLEDKNIQAANSVFFETALVSKAFSMHKNFDLYHINMGNGEYILPYARFIKKPVVVTMHGPLNIPFQKKYYPLFKDLKNVFFVSISNAQRKPIPDLNYIKTIYHGIDINKSFQFNPTGGNSIIWTGRATPDKGLDVFLTVIKKVKKNAKVFPILKGEYLDWLHQEVINKRSILSKIIRVYIDFDVNRLELAQHYQTSKLFLFPVLVEEGFGLTLVESMACGTPVVAYAKGSIPEVIEDGVTGFIVNSSKDDIRGNWIIKKTGVDGLCEAVERIYNLSPEKYLEMRQACRTRAENKFTAERMANEYVDVYKEVFYKYKSR